MGLEGLSIGALAELTHMSKSGVFAHFGSREELQIAVIREYHERFEDEVFFPAMHEPRGVPRLRALFERWIRRVSVEIDSGCIYISGAVEFDDRPGPVRDALVSMVRSWHATLETRDPHRHRRRPAARRHRRPPDAVRDARPDPRAAPRRALSHARPVRWSARAWPSSACSAITWRCRARASAPRATDTGLHPLSQEPTTMPQYTPPLRDMQFVLHELLKVVDELKTLPRHADIDADTINSVLEEGGKFAAEVLFPLNHSGDEQGCKLDKTTHAVTAPAGFKEAYAQFVEGGWPALSADPEYGGQGLPIVLNQCLVRDAELGQPGLDHVPGPVARRL